MVEAITLFQYGGAIVAGILILGAAVATITLHYKRKEQYRGASWRNYDD